MEFFSTTDQGNENISQKAITTTKITEIIMQFHQDESILDRGANNDEDDEARVQCYANYCLENAGQSVSNDPPVLDNELGLAMEKLPEGMDRKSLWQIIF